MSQEVKSEGIILRTRPFTETSLIAWWLTPSLGRIQTVAKGALRPKSNFRGKLDLYFFGEFTYQPARKSTLHILREVKISESNQWLRKNMSALEAAAYATSLIEQATEAETPLEKIYPLFCEFLLYLKTNPPAALASMAFEVQLLGILGMTPRSEKLNPATSAVIRELQENPWTSSIPDPSGFKQAYQFLHDFIIFHLGRLPKNRPPL